MTDQIIHVDVNLDNYFKNCKKIKIISIPRYKLKNISLGYYIQYVQYKYKKYQ